MKKPTARDEEAIRIWDSLSIGEQHAVLVEDGDIPWLLYGCLEAKRLVRRGRMTALGERVRAYGKTQK